MDDAKDAKPEKTKGFTDYELEMVNELRTSIRGSSLRVEDNVFTDMGHPSLLVQNNGMTFLVRVRKVPIGLFGVPDGQDSSTSE